MGGDWGVGAAGADAVVDAGACAGAVVPAVASTMGFFGGGRGPWLIERMAWGLATCVPGIGRALGAAPRMAPVGELGIAGERTIVGLRACCAPLRVRKGGRAGPESTRGAPGACMLGMRPWPKPGRTGRPWGAPGPPGPGTGRDTGITGIDMRFMAEGCARGPCWRWGVVPMGGFQLLRPVAVSTNTFLPAAASLDHVRNIFKKHVPLKSPARRQLRRSGRLR